MNLATAAVCLAAALMCARGQLAGQEKDAAPEATLADDLRALAVPVRPGYADRRPRLLFGPEDREVLAQKAQRVPEMWAEVVASGRRLGGGLPSSEEIRAGRYYWRIERVESGALAYFITKDRWFLDAASRWMVAHCREDVWGTDYRPNIDLQAAWYLYHIAVAYDILHDDLSPADRQMVRDGLASHARAIHESFSPSSAEKYRYDQNHTYIPAVALATSSLALLGEVPEASEWLTRSYAVMRRCRYVLSEDGYYYEGYGYWSYALHWHGRYAEVMARATGKEFYDLPVLRENWRYARYLSLPGPPYAFDMNDMGRWSGTRRPSVSVNNYHFLWSAGKALNSPRSSDVADFLSQRCPERDYPAAAFLAFHERKEKNLPLLPAFHHFADHDVVVWRSGWDDDATCLAFRCGPPLGHSALAKTRQLKDWTMNCGHVHPDIGGFWLFARGAYLATDTGYTAEKWTRDHNTLLVDSRGQAMDGSYWNERGFPYEKLDACRIDRIKLTDAFCFVSGEFGSAYDRVAPGLTLRRTVAAGKEWMLVADEMEAAEPRTLTWLCHSDAPFVREGSAWVARQEVASLAVCPLAPHDLDCVSETTVVVAGTSPGQGTPTERGYHLALTSQKARSVKLITLLLPLGREETVSRVALSERTGDGKTVVTFAKKTAAGTAVITVAVDTGWRQAQGGEPVEVRVSR